MTVVSANAQRRGYVCTGNNVNVRTGPGKNYSVVVYNSAVTQMFKGCVAQNLGKKRNGFIYVGFLDRSFLPSIIPIKGWVSAQYLRAVTLCSKCDGWGISGYDECSKCRGKGYL